MHAIFKKRPIEFGGGDKKIIYLTFCMGFNSHLYIYIYLHRILA